MNNSENMKSKVHNSKCKKIKYSTCNEVTIAECPWRIATGAPVRKHHIL